MTTHTATDHGLFALPGRAGFIREPSRTATRHQPLRGLAALPARLLAAVRRFMEERAAIAELSELSDRHLADIGISRSDIPRAVTSLDFAGRR